MAHRVASGHQRRMGEEITENAPRGDRYGVGMALGTGGDSSMLAWIANSVPAQLKATFFAVMASFTNLALSLSTLGTKYLNQLFLVTREVGDQATGALVVPADYSELGILLITVTALSLLLPMATILIIQKSPWHSE
jgi:hypothetical protein